MSGERRQCVRFLFLRLDPAWRRLPGEEQARQRAAFIAALADFQTRMLLRTYSLIGTRGDCDLLFWQAAADLETLQEFGTALFSTELGASLQVAYSYLAMTRRSEYDLAALTAQSDGTAVRPTDCRYLYVYPFVKKREWYRLPFEQREALMKEHVEVGRRFPNVRINTTYSFGLDDQEFVVSFENDDPAEFLDLVMALRGSGASAYTEIDIPVFTCLRASLRDVLESLGGRQLEQFDPPLSSGLPRPPQQPHATAVPLEDVPSGTGRRIYVGGEAVALFNCDGRFFAVSDRCSHARASLSDGTVDIATCLLTCPWHQGMFDLRTGRPAGGPPVVPLRTYEVTIDGNRAVIGPQPHSPAGTSAPRA